MRPLVSIVIPVFNGADYLRDAIESALGQTYRNIEVIVVNDGSNDRGATEAVAQSFGDRICYLSKENGHVASALNHGIRSMRGEYFSWLSHDDRYHPNKIEAQVEVLATLGPRTVVYSDFETLDVVTGAITPVRMTHVPPEEFRVFITLANSVHGCTLLVPKACFDECGLFNETLRTTQDYDMWFRIVGRYPFVHLPEILVTARLHPGQGSHQLRGVALRECDELLARFVDNLSHDEIRSAMDKPLSVAYSDIAVNMHRRSFPRARNHAIDLFRKQLRTEAAVRAARLYLTLVIRLIIAPGSRLHGLVSRGVRGVGRSFGRVAHTLGSLRSLRRRFSNMYRENAFGGRESRSGEGSGLAQTTIIRSELEHILREFGVRSLLDAPCGDFHWMRHVDLPGAQYIGVDIVDELIVDNQRRHGGMERSFRCLNLIKDALPHTDLILCRDCLVHLNFAQAKRALLNFKRSGAKYLLTTTFTDRDTNADLKGADIWRPLNLQRPPFNLPKPLRIINEGCTEGGGAFGDKALGLWPLQELDLD